MGKKKREEKEKELRKAARLGAGGCQDVKVRGMPVAMHGRWSVV